MVVISFYLKKENDKVMEILLNYSFYFEKRASLFKALVAVSASY